MARPAGCGTKKSEGWRMIFWRWVRRRKAMGKKLSSFFMVKDENMSGLPEEHGGYESILKEVQQYVSDNYAGELQATLEDAAAKKALFDIVLQHVAAREFSYRDYTP